MRLPYFCSRSTHKHLTVSDHAAINVFLCKHLADPFTGSVSDTRVSVHALPTGDIRSVRAATAGPPGAAPRNAGRQ